MEKIKLTKGKIAIVDDKDYEWLNQWKWCITATYASRKRGKELIYMHRQITVCPKGMVVDHINHDRLDNRRENLRICTTLQNTSNIGKPKKKTSSKYLGVSWDKLSSKWLASIAYNNKNYMLGRFDNEKEAAIVRDRKALEFRKEFAILNFPDLLTNKTL